MKKYLRGWFFRVDAEKKVFFYLNDRKKMGELLFLVHTEIGCDCGLLIPFPNKPNLTCKLNVDSADFPEKRPTHAPIRHNA